MSTGASYPRVLVLGDSLATGRDASIVVNAFPRLIVSGLVARGNGSAQHYLIHGVGGAATGALSSSGDGMLANLEAFGIVPAADLVVLELSTNDWAHNITVAQFQSDLAALMSYLLGGSHQPLAVVCLTPWVAPATTNGLGEPASAYANAIAAQVAATQSSYPQMAVHMVDIGSLAANADYHCIHTCIDTFHPNDAGHDAIAGAVLGVI